MKHFISTTVLFLMFFFQCLGSSENYSYENDSTKINEIKTDSLQLKVDLLKTQFASVSSTNSIIKQPLNYIINYLENDTIKNIYFYLKNFRQTDSLDYYSNYLKTETTNIDSLNKKLLRNDSLKNTINYLLDYISQDSVTKWLNEIKKDSLNICLKNIKNDSLNIYLKNDNNKYSRFWLKNTMNDSIGIWLNNLNKHSFRILIDDDIFTKSISRRIQKNILKSQQKNLNSLMLIKKKVPKITPDLWKFFGTTSINVSQGYLSNWAEGGASSISLLSSFKLHADYSKDDTKWNNTIDLKYGILKTEDENLRKNEDKIELSSKFGQNAFNNWYYSIFGNLKTQFSKGYEYPNDSVEISNFMNPAYIILAFGLDYKVNSKFSMLISPVTSKFTIVLDTTKIDQTKYGLSNDEIVKKEFGAYFKIQYKFKITDDINIDNKLNLFSNYNNNPQNIDINYEANINMKINDFINTTIRIHLIYDDDVRIPVYKKINGIDTKTGTTKKFQFKELLSVGIAYKF
ncbi:MAG: DUF3078 domain-containing protein [Bacteroidetes bacterium]|nr:DUF3078 domain-containing protein [Bacteroidota bacterium]